MRTGPFGKIEEGGLEVQVLRKLLTWTLGHQLHMSLTSAFLVPGFWHRTELEISFSLGLQFHLPVFATWLLCFIVTLSLLRAYSFKYNLSFTDATY